MPPLVASFLTVCFIIFLFRWEKRQGHPTTGALWIPLLWMLIIGSRFVSQWLEVFGLKASGGTLEEGSPIDAFVFFGLLGVGFYALSKRRITLAEVVRNNRWLTIYLLYCLLAILWSDFPFVAFKRWIKILGHPIMALLILTEPNPEEALIRLMKRSAFILIPVSVLFLKYYPEFSRGFDYWTGTATNTGITRDKNALGYLCMVFGFFFVWQLLKALSASRSPERRNELVMCGVFLSMVLWLLILSDAKTALMTFLVSSFTAVLLGTRLIIKRLIGVYIVAGVIVALSAELFFGIYAGTIHMLGRNPTLTDRTEVWKDVLEMDSSPILGAGFESFWLGERLEKLWSKYWWQPNQSHNGYIETYLNLGIVGLIILAALMLATFRKIRWALIRNSELGRFRLSLLLAILLFNYTDAIFKALHPLWFVFYIVAMDYPVRRFSPQITSQPDDKAHDLELVAARCSV